MVIFLHCSDSVLMLCAWKSRLCSRTLLRAVVYCHVIFVASLRLIQLSYAGRAGHRGILLLIAIAVGFVPNSSRPFPL